MKEGGGEGEEGGREGGREVDNVFFVCLFFISCSFLKTYKTCFL